MRCRIPIRTPTAGCRKGYGASDCSPRPAKGSSRSRCWTPAGGINVAADLLGVTETLLAIKTAPEALHRLLDNIQDLYARTIRAGIEAAGGEEFITTTDYPDIWFPEGCKGHASDDICANFGPATYAEFSAPYHARIFEEFGRGGLHNCGPNPCHAAYVAASLVAPLAGPGRHVQPQGPDEDEAFAEEAGLHSAELGRQP